MSLPLEKVQQILDEYNKRNAATSGGITLGLAQTREELEEVVQVVARAFVDYALYDWMFVGIPQEERAKINVFFARYVQRECRTAGFIIMAKDESERIVGAAQVNHRERSSNIIIRPLQSLMAKTYTYMSIFFGRTGLPPACFYRSNPEFQTFQRRANAFEQIGKAHDEIMGETTHHLYLIMLATEPALKKQGVGKKLLAGLADIADSIGVATYLETDADHLKAFYERNGYECKRDFVLTDKDGDFSPNFSMVRPAKQ